MFANVTMLFEVSLEGKKVKFYQSGFSTHKIKISLR